MKFVATAAASILAFNLASAQPATLDTSFNPGTGASGTIYSVDVQSDGKFVVTGSFTSFNGLPRKYVARLLSDGTLDQNFDPLVGADSSVRTAAIQSDGKLFIGGDFTSFNGLTRNYLARLREDASLDINYPNATFNGSIFSVSVDVTNQVIARGSFTSVNSVIRNGLARLLSTGAVDATFNPCVGIQLGAPINDHAIQTDGKILVVGNFTSVSGTNRYGIARVLRTGVLDLTFDAGFISPSSIDKVLLQPDGKVLIAGSFSSIDGYSRQGVARLHTNGVLDTSFVLPTTVSSVNCIALQGDGKVLVGGAFSYAFGQSSRSYFARLNPNGSLDSSFYPVFGSLVYDFNIAADGKILVVGAFQTVNGTSIKRIARMHNDTTSSNGSSALTIALHPALTVTGTAGQTYRIEYTTNVNAALWNPITNVTLSSSQLLVVDPEPAQKSNRFYRAVLVSE